MIYFCLLVLVWIVYASNTLSLFRSWTKQLQLDGNIKLKKYQYKGGKWAVQGQAQPTRPLRASMPGSSMGGGLNQKRTFI